VLVELYRLRKGFQGMVRVGSGGGGGRRDGHIGTRGSHYPVSLCRFDTQEPHILELRFAREENVLV
jgi:hypothetical protein